MKYTLECTHEEDGRWLAEVPQLHGAAAYGDSEAGARIKAQALALRMLAEQLEAGGCAPFEISMSIMSVRNPDDADPEPSAPADQAAYDAWFVAKVQEALDDDSPTMSTDEVMRYVRADVFGK
jgi:predicted RNase H-like HicB family nuclease